MSVLIAEVFGPKVDEYPMLSVRMIGALWPSVKWNIPMRSFIKSYSAREMER